MLKVTPIIVLAVSLVAVAACTTVPPTDPKVDENVRLESGESESSVPSIVRESPADGPGGESPQRKSRRAKSVTASWQWQSPSYQKWAEATLIDEGVPLIFSEPADIADYCPAWPQLDGYERLRFWADLLAAMAVHESRHDPEARHVERFNDRFGEPVVSRGLLQLSQESANGYGCGIRRAEQLHNPAENIRCAVRILSRWVIEDGVISAYVSTNNKKSARPWRGGARYWSVLRANNKTADIQNNLRRSARCKLPGKYADATEY